MCSETASSDGNASKQLGHATVAAEAVPLAAASGRREAEEEMRGVKGVDSAGADGRGGGGACLGAGLGLRGLGLAGREEDEEDGEGPEPRTWEVPLKVEGEEEVTFFMRSFILSFIMAADDGEMEAGDEETRRANVGGEGIWARSRKRVSGAGDEVVVAAGTKQTRKEWGSNKAGGSQANGRCSVVLRCQGISVGDYKGQITHGLS
jgi:hypothetical protein